jgi:hypothetical protein
VQIDCGGSPPKEVVSRSSFSLIPWHVLKGGDSLGSVWRTQAPPRAIFFVWPTALSKILTLDNLRRRHVIVTNICCMCKRSEEMVDHHHLLHFEVAYAL